MIHGDVQTRLDALLAARCASCREVLPPDVPVVNHGDLQFHLACQPSCSICRRALQVGEGGWRSEGRVVSEPWGYAVRPTRFLCSDCLGTAPRDEPRGSF